MEPSRSATSTAVSATAANGPQLLLPTGAPRGVVGGKDPAAECGCRVERVQCLREIARGRILIGDEQREFQRGVVLADRAGTPATRSRSGSSPSATGRAFDRYGAEVAAGDLGGGHHSARADAAVQRSPAA